MAAEDVSALLQLVANAHQRLREENHKLLRDNERLCNLLNDKIVGQQEKETMQADASNAEGSLSSTCDIPNQDENFEIKLACVGDAALTHADLKGSDNPQVQSHHKVSGEACSFELHNSPSSVEQDADHVCWYMGQWADLSGNGSFFNGVLIDICKHTWKPRKRQYAHRFGTNRQDAETEYSIDIHKDSNTISLLLENRATGEKRVYKAIPGPQVVDKKTMVVSLEGDNPMRWTLFANPKAQTREDLASDIKLMLTHQKTTERSFHVALGYSVRLVYLKVTMCFIILGTVISLGVEVEVDLPGRTASAELLKVLQIFNIFSAVAFILEICIVVRQKAMHKHMNIQFATNLFVTVNQTACEVMHLVTNKNYLLWKCVVLIRIYRLLRVSRLFRNKHSDTVKLCWRLLSGLISTATTVITMLLLVLLFLYTFSCVGLEVIYKSDYLKDRLSKEDLTMMNSCFGGLFQTMVTLFQFVTLDSVSAFYVPLIKANPWLTLYFLPILLVVSISLLNMVTGVIVEKAMTQANNDRKAKHSELSHKVQMEHPVFMEFFVNIDKQHPSVLRRDEFQNLDDNLMPALLKESLEQLNITSRGELFDLLDADESNTLTEDEFVQGMLHLRLAALKEPHEIHFVHMHTRTALKKAKVLESLLGDLVSEQAVLWTAITELKESMSTFMADGRVADHWMSDSIHPGLVNI